MRLKDNELEKCLEPGMHGSGEPSPCHAYLAALQKLAWHAAPLHLMGKDICNCTR